MQWMQRVMYDYTSSCFFFVFFSQGTLNNPDLFLSITGEWGSRASQTWTKAQDQTLSPIRVRGRRCPTHFRGVPKAAQSSSEGFPAVSVNTLSSSPRLLAETLHINHGGHQEENANVEAGQGERHRPRRAGWDWQERCRGQMQTGKPLHWDSVSCGSDCVLNEKKSGKVWRGVVVAVI